jgi:ABC-type transport system involved in multi-copper enzyme maturation permease subunit
MLKRIFAIVENSWSYLISKKAIYVLVTFIFVGFWIPLGLQMKWYRLMSVTVDDARAMETIILYCRLLIFMGFSLSFFFAASMVETELTHRTLVNILVRPILRWEYLIGRLMGPLMLYFLFVFSATMFSVAATFLWGGHINGDFILGVLQHFTKDLCLLLIVFSLGTVFSPVIAIVSLLFIFSLIVMVNIMPDDLYAFVPMLKMAFHYFTPAAVTTDYFKNNQVSFDWQTLLLNLTIMLENLLYGAVFFLFAALMFARSDITLKADS